MNILKLTARLVFKYAELLSFGIFFLGCLLTLTPIVLYGFPKLPPPNEGFSTRGTTISRRLETWNNVRDAVILDKKWTRFPKVAKYKKSQIVRARRALVVDQRDDVTRDERHNQTEFCNFLPTSNYALLALRLRDPFSYGTMRKLCKLQKRIFLGKTGRRLLISEFCDRAASGNCCQPWSIASIASTLSNRSDCDALTPKDVKHLFHLVVKCYPYREHLLFCLKNQFALANCKHPKLTEECNKMEFFILFHYLIAKEDSRCATTGQTGCNLFSNGNLTKEPYLTTMDTLLILPVAKGAFSQRQNPARIIKNIQRECDRQHPHITLTAMDFGIREVLFEKMLLQDLLYALGAFAIILVVIWLYTKSIIYTIACLISMIFSIGSSYFVYTIVFRISFFPFVNMLTMILLIGIGTDDAFILHKTLTLANQEDNGRITKETPEWLHQAYIAMLTTSITTAAAFYANLLSPIVVIRCFSLYAGTMILSNNIFSILWLPSVTIALRRRGLMATNASKSRLVASLESGTKKCLEHLSGAIVRMDKIFTGLFLTLALGSAVLVVTGPEMDLPNLDQFQFFKSTHFLEKWPLEIRDKFEFTSEQTEIPMLIHVLWGVEENSQADPFDPNDTGSLRSKEFNPWHNQSYVWMANFCKSLAGQNYVDLDKMPIMISCFMDDFLTLLKRRPCNELGEEGVQSDCCATSTLRPGRVEECFKEFQAKYREQLEELEMFTFKNAMYNEPVLGPLYLNDQDKLVAMVATFFSNAKFSNNFENASKFFNTVEQWMQSALPTAPEGVGTGWFISDHLNVYDLQLALVESTKKAVPVSAAFAVVVLAVMTRNLTFTFLAILTVVSAISFLVVCLTLLGWQLNVVESTTIALAIGLAFDYTLHYAAAYVAFQLHKSPTPIKKLVYSTTLPVTMSTLTTAIGGFSMLFTDVYAYFQVGIFMLLLAIISFIFSTFLFLPLISVVSRVHCEHSTAKLCCSFEPQAYFNSSRRRRDASKKFSAAVECM